MAVDLLFRPLRLDRVNGESLAVLDVTPVMQLGGPDAADAPASRDGLRVLGLFSLPEGGQPLNLRRERQALTIFNGRSYGLW